MNSGFLKVYRLGRSSFWLSEGEEARVEPGSRTRSAGGACAGDGGGPGGIGVLMRAGPGVAALRLGEDLPQGQSFDQGGRGGGDVGVAVGGAP